MTVPLLRDLLMIQYGARRSGPGSQLSVNVNFYYSGPVDGSEEAPPGRDELCLEFGL